MFIYWKSYGCVVNFLIIYHAQKPRAVWMFIYQLFHWMAFHPAKESAADPRSALSSWHQKWTLESGSFDKLEKYFGRPMGSFFILNTEREREYLSLAPPAAGAKQICVCVCVLDLMRFWLSTTTAEPVNSPSPF